MIPTDAKDAQLEPQAAVELAAKMENLALEQEIQKEIPESTNLSSDTAPELESIFDDSRTTRAYDLMDEVESFIDSMKQLQKARKLSERPKKIQDLETNNLHDISKYLDDDEKPKYKDAVVDQRKQKKFQQLEEHAVYEKIKARFIDEALMKGKKEEVMLRGIRKSQAAEVFTVPEFDGMILKVPKYSYNLSDFKYTHPAITLRIPFNLAPLYVSIEYPPYPKMATGLGKGNRFYLYMYKYFGIDDPLQLLYLSFENDHEYFEILIDLEKINENDHEFVQATNIRKFTIQLDYEYFQKSIMIETSTENFFEFTSEEFKQILKKKKAQ